MALPLERRVLDDERFCVALRVVPELLAMMIPFAPRSNNVLRLCAAAIWSIAQQLPLFHDVENRVSVAAGRRMREGL